MYATPEILLCHPSHNQRAHSSFLFSSTSAKYQTVRGNVVTNGPTRLNSNQNSKKQNFDTNGYIKRVEF